jgi:hypothetical protein
MPYFKKNEGFSLGFSPYTRGDASPFKSTPASRIKDAKRNAKFDYRNAIAGTRDPALRKQARKDYRIRMQKIREREKNLRMPKKFKSPFNKLKRTLNPFDSHHRPTNQFGYKPRKLKIVKNRPKADGAGGYAEIER